VFVVIDGLRGVGVRSRWCGVSGVPDVKVETMT
jgi:hypothetical protein